MGIYSSDKNFGYGRKMDFAGKTALQERYGGGHFATAAAHGGRWAQFCAWAKGEGVRDARGVSQGVLSAYAAHVGQQVDQGRLSVAYAQNLPSSANVALSALRGDNMIRVSPAEHAGERSKIRDTAPGGQDKVGFQSAVHALREGGLQRAVSVAELARNLGLRSKEASLLDARKALAEARKTGHVTISLGTKGGQARIVQITNKSQVDSLASAAMTQGGARSVMPEGKNWAQWRNGELRAGRESLKSHGIDGYHELRAAYACERYLALAGRDAPVLGGKIVDRNADRAARMQIAEELGHHRIDVVAEYIGGRK